MLNMPGKMEIAVAGHKQKRSKRNDDEAPKGLKNVFQDAHILYF